MQGSISTITLTDCIRNTTGIQLRDYNDKVELAVQIYQVIVDSADIYFGVKASNLSDALIKSVVTEITKKFETFTIDEIEYSYERFAKERTDWRNVTKNDLIQPIQLYSTIKMKVKSEINKMQQEEIDYEEKVRKEEEFKQKAIDTYRFSLDMGKWMGDIFQARAIFKEFKDFIPKDVKTSIDKATVIEYRRLQDKMKLEFTLYTPERIFANKIVEFAVANKIVI